MDTPLAIKESRRGHPGGVTKERPPRRGNTYLLPPIRITVGIPPTINNKHHSGYRYSHHYK